MYRVKEIQITPTYSEYKIQCKFLFIWFTVTVNEKYLCSLSAAREWINLQAKGYPTQKFYYEK